MMGVVAILSGITLFISGCNHATGGNQSTSSNQRTDGKQNNTNNMEVLPTGPADSYLEGTQWENSSNDKVKINFASDVNIAVIIGIGGDNGERATYSVKDFAISFDLSQYVTLMESLTVDKYVEGMIASLESAIYLHKEEIAKGNNVEYHKTRLKEVEEVLEEVLEMVKNQSPEYQAELEKEVAARKEKAEKLKPHAKFTGKLNPSKTELIVDEYPVYDTNAKTFIVAKDIVLQKQ